MDSELSMVYKTVIEARQTLSFSQTALQLNLLPANSVKNGGWIRLFNACVGIEHH